MNEKPQPDFRIGQLVRVRLNERNRTPHTGTIEQGVWHFKSARYHYWLIENGKSIHHRYSADDLEPVAD